MNDNIENELLDATTPPEERVNLPKKRFGFWGKFVAFLLGIIIGVGSLCGTVFIVAGNVKIKKLTNFVGGFAGFDYETFVEKDYVSEALGDETIMQALANLGYTAKQNKLAPFCYYFPTLEDGIDAFVKELQEMGIEAETSEVLEQPINEINTYLKEKINTAELGKIMKAASSTGKLDDLKMELCYGHEGQDYLKNKETGEIIMINGSKPTTVGDISDDTKGVLNRIMLSHVIKEDPKNKIIMYVLYGKENVEYKFIPSMETIGDEEEQMQIAEKDGIVYDASGNEVSQRYTFAKNVYTDNKGVRHYLGEESGETINVGGEELKLHYLNHIEMLQMQIAIKNGKVYDFYGDEMLREYTWDEAKGLYIDKDGKKHYLDGRVQKEVEEGRFEDATVEVADGVFADLYYVQDENGEDILYHPTTVGEMAEERCHLTTLTERMTVGELMNGDPNDPEDKVYGNKILKHLADATIETMPDQIKALTFRKVFEKEIFDESTGEVKGTWKYMLKDKATVDENDNPLTEEQRIEKGLNYSITEDMSKIMDNMTVNMKNATLLELDGDGIIDMNDDDLNNKSVPTTKLPGSEEFLFGSFAGKKLGELTVNEMLQVTVISISSFN